MAINIIWKTASDKLNIQLPCKMASVFLPGKIACIAAKAGQNNAQVVASCAPLARAQAQVVGWLLSIRIFSFCPGRRTLPIVSEFHLRISESDTLNFREIRISESPDLTV